MGHHEIQFPQYEGWEHEGGPGYETAIGKPDSGIVRAVQRRQNPERRYVVRMDANDHEQVEEVLRFYVCRGGLANSFNYLDPRDHTTNPAATPIDGTELITAEDQVLGVGDGVTTQFQLIKRYEDSAGTYVRKLEKIDVGTTLISVNSVTKTAGTDFTVNLTTGVVTLATAAPSGHVVAGGCRFFVPVRFGIEVDEALRARLSAPELQSLVPIPLVEESSPTSPLEDLRLGGAKKFLLADGATVTIDFTATMYELRDTIATTKVLLPDLATCPEGGPICIIHNPNSGTPAVKTHDDATTVYTFVGIETRAFYVGYDSLGAKKWVVL